MHRTAGSWIERPIVANRLDAGVDPVCRSRAGTVAARANVASISR